MGLFSALFGSGSTEPSIDEIRKLARSNNAYSLQMALKEVEAGKSGGAFAIGNMFESGRTLLGESAFPKSAAKAFAWKLKAANEGEVQAQTQLGFLYYFGEDAKNNIVGGRNHAEAIRWLVKASASGGFFANYALGEMCLKGLGVPCDNGEAFSWFQKSINHKWAKQFGFYDAAARLAEMYAAGLGVTKDLVQSYKWSKVSGLLEGKAIGANLNLRQAMTPSDIARAEAEATEWLKGAAQKANLHPGYLLAEGCWPPT